MLTREQSEAQLKAFQIKNWQKVRSDELGKLSVNLRTLGRALIDRDPDGKGYKNWEKQYKARNKATEDLQKLNAADRRRLFEVFFPKLADAIEAGWQLHRTLPYETASDRKGFRVPNDETAKGPSRATWFYTLLRHLDGYDFDVVEVATWAPYLGHGYGGDELGILLAATIDAGGELGKKVQTILEESASNQHEIGTMGRHVTRAFLVCSNPDAWSFVERLLIAAQRQEGLRQVILESVDEAHPTAFKRMLRLILEKNLLRFASCVRAVDVWFGLQWDALTPAVLKKTVEQALSMLEDPEARARAIASDKSESLLIALWAIAMEDAQQAIEPAAKLLSDPVVERRFIGAQFLGDLDLPEARKKLLVALDDSDLRIVSKVLDNLPPPEDSLDLWDKLLELLPKFPAKRQEGEALVWPWATTSIHRSDVANALLARLGKRPATAILPFLADLNYYQKGEAVEKLGKLKNWDAATRDTLFAMVGDRDHYVREKALKALKRCSITVEDAQRIEAILVRKNSDMRRAALTLIVKQKAPLALASADRLLGSKKAPQRMAGLELLRLMVEKKRLAEECRKRAREYQTKFLEPSEEEQLQLDIVLDVQREKPSLVNSFGLSDPANRSKPILPVARKVTLCTSATVELLVSLDQLIHKHRETPIKIQNYGYEEEEVLLGNIRWQFPSPNFGQPLDRDLSRLPLREVWEEWYDNRPKKLRDNDGLELIRAMVWQGMDKSTLTRLRKSFGKTFSGWLDLLSNKQEPVKLKYGHVVNDILAWLERIHPPTGAMDFLLDVVETGYASVPDELRRRVVDLENWQKRDRDWRNNSPLDQWTNAYENFQNRFPEAVKPEHRIRQWQLEHWRDEPVLGVGRMRPDLSLLIAGVNAGQANEADLFDQILGPGDDDFSALSELTTPGRLQTYNCPALDAVVSRATERILEIELARGEMPTPATNCARAVRSLSRLATMLRVLHALGKKPLARQSYGEGKAIVLTHLVRICRPTPEDTLEVFAQEAKKAGLNRERLLQLAFSAPQWLDHIEHAIGWPGLKEGIWWFLAHMPGGHSGLDPLIENDEFADYDDFDDFDDIVDDDVPAPPPPLSPWEQLIRERTPITAEDRAYGAVDAGWFQRVYEPLGRKKWDVVAEAAKYGCDGGGFKKAIRLADVLLGRANKAALISEVRDRKLKESVRLLGLLPLPMGPKRDAELLSRYKILVEYRRYARSLSPMSREDTERTANIGLENLARTAGYSDPIRLEWAMEGRQIADLAAGPVAVTAEGVTVTLAIDSDAQLQMTVQRGDRVLKAVPPAARKNPKMAAHLERRGDIKRQASRVRQTLESMMVRGETFAGRELKQMMIHPLLRPLLERLVILGEGIMGYPVAEGLALADHKGKKEPVKPDETLRIAHAHDLFTAGSWDKWQSDCFRTERVQPFKQVFRELYVVTAQEKSDSGASSRYASQQVNPSQAMALWGSRGWNTREGVEKTFYQDGVVASVNARHHGWTAAEVSGLTLDTVSFRRRGDWRTIPLEEVPPRIFSEVMRDCDLVVSVAHVGGVDPEASASTVQMRESLVRETCSVLKIDNFEVKGNHVLVTGQLGRYSIHLGSGVVHRQPGGHLCIIAVQAQQRGRLFLPFADDDPRTAEVITKVITLARDHEIQDPTILEQLR